MHAVGRLALHPWIANIQVSWVKAGPAGRASRRFVRASNDLGGTLMNESISRAAGAAWGQELPPEQMEALIRSAGRVPRQRTTLYGRAAGGAGRALVRRRSRSREPRNPHVNDARLAAPAPARPARGQRPLKLLGRHVQDDLGRDGRDTRDRIERDPCRHERSGPPDLERQGEPGGASRTGRVPGR